MFFSLLIYKIGHFTNKNSYDTFKKKGGFINQIKKASCKEPTLF